MSWLSLIIQRVNLQQILKKAKIGAVPWYQVLAKPEIRFLRSDPLLDPKGCYTVIATKLAGILYHNSSLSSSILKGERNQDRLRPEQLLIPKDGNPFLKLYNHLS
jgi:ABC-type molybdate transport system substrate-binding protein